MTTTIVFGETSDGYIESSSPTYSTARAGGSLVVNDTGTSLLVGQGRVDVAGGRFCMEGFLAFDLDGISPSDEVTDADLVVHQIQGRVDASFTVEAREYDWGATLDSGDWVAGASLGDVTPLLATLASSTQSDTIRTFTPSSTNLVDHVQAHLGDVSRVLLNSSRHRIGNGPGDFTFEDLELTSADASGTTNDPRLVIEHEEAAPPEGSILEVFDGDTWAPLALEVFDGGTWQPLSLEAVP